MVQDADQLTRQMKFVFNGLSYFGKKLTADLKAYAPQHSFSFFDTYSSKMEQVKFTAALPFADLLISLNGVTEKSGSLDLAMKMSKKILLHWQGSDVLIALEQAKKTSLNRTYIDYSSNFTDAPWMKDELNAIGINCGILHYKWLNANEEKKPYHNTSACTYLAEGKELFYGWQIIRNLAEKFPELNFYVAGTRGEKLEKRKNIHFLGWIAPGKMQELRNENPIFLRLAEHDGYSLSVLEALAAGNEVIWSMPHPQCHFANTSSGAIAAFQKCIDTIRSNKNMPNKKNKDYIKENCSRDKILGTFVKKLEELAGK